MGIFDHSSRSVRSDTDVGQKAWLTVSALIHPKGVLSGWGQDSVQASQVLPHQTGSSMSLWTSLCALVRSHVGTGRVHPQTVSTKLGAWNCPKSLGMLKHSEFLAPESNGGVLYTTASDTLHCSWWCMAWMQLPWKPIPWSSLSTVLELMWRPHEVWRSVAIGCRKLATSAHCAPQHPLTPLCHLTWPTTLWPSCCRSQSLPLCYKTTDSWRWNI